MIPSLYITCVHNIVINDVKYNNIPDELNEFIDEYKRLYNKIDSMTLDLYNTCKCAFYYKYNNVGNKLYKNILETPEHYGMLMIIASFIGDLNRIKQIYSKCKTFCYNYDGKELLTNEDCKPFINAVSNEHFDTADYILENIKYDNNLLKIYACGIAITCNVKSIKYLIKKGVKFDENETFICNGCELNHEFVDYFIGNLCSYNKKNLKIIKYLHNNLDIDINVISSCIYGIIKNKYHKTLKYLFNYDWEYDNINEINELLQDIIKNTCVHDKKLYKIVKLLYNNNLLDGIEDQILDYALQYENYKIAHYLVKKDIKITKYNKNIFGYINHYKYKSISLISQCIDDKIITSRHKKIKILLNNILNNIDKNNLIKYDKIIAFIK